MNPLAMLGLGLTSGMGFAKMMGLKSLMNNFFAFDTHLKQYYPEQRELIVNELRARGIHVKAPAENLDEMVNDLKTGVESFQKNCLNTNDLFLQELKGLGLTDEKLLNDIQTNMRNQRFGNDYDFNKADHEIYNATDDLARALQSIQKNKNFDLADIEPRLFRLRETVSDKIDEAQKQEMERLKAILRSANGSRRNPGIQVKIEKKLEEVHKSQKEEALKPFTDAINKMTELNNSLFEKDFVLAQNEHVLKEIRDWKAAKKRRDQNNSQAVSTTDTVFQSIDDIAKEMSDIEITNLKQMYEDLKLVNDDPVNPLTGDDRLTLKASNGYEIEIIKKPNGEYAVSTKLPFMANFVFYLRPYQNIKAISMAQIQVCIAMGALENGGFITLEAKCSYEPQAKKSACEAYLAAIEMGLDVENITFIEGGKKYVAKINGVSKTNEEMLKLINQNDMGHRLQSAESISSEKHKTFEDRNNKFTDSAQKTGKEKQDEAIQRQSQVVKDAYEKLKDNNDLAGLGKRNFSPIAEEPRRGISQN